MRYLIAQGPGYYGVNIRKVNEEDVKAIMHAMADHNMMAEKIMDNTVDYTCQMDDGTCLILTKPVHDEPGTTVREAAGFDTGWWDEGNAAIAKVLK